MSTTVELLRQYKELFDEGIITEAEFQTKKSELLFPKDTLEDISGISDQCRSQYRYVNQPQMEPMTADPKVQKINKHIFVWVFTFALGYLGIDRFIRGQIPLGILKLLSCGGLGIWSLVDFIIALVNVYGSKYAATEDVTFINGQYAV